MGFRRFKTKITISWKDPVWKYIERIEFNAASRSFTFWCSAESTFSFFILSIMSSTNCLLFFLKFPLISKGSLKKAKVGSCYNFSFRISRPTGHEEGLFPGSLSKFQFASATSFRLSIWVFSSKKSEG
jgi:hypothetical protein